MKKISSILPTNSRITTVDYSSDLKRRPGAYNPISGSVEKSFSSRIESQNNKFKVANEIQDTVSLSPEAQKKLNDTQGSSPNRKPVVDSLIVNNRLSRSQNSNLSSDSLLMKGYEKLRQKIDGDPSLPENIQAESTSEKSEYL